MNLGLDMSVNACQQGKGIIAPRDDQVAQALVGTALSTDLKVKAFRKPSNYRLLDDRLLISSVGKLGAHRKYG